MSVVEFLTFHVPADQVDEWLEVEARHWTRFLERQPGFLDKEMWRPVDRPDVVHAVIWWASLEQWKAIPPDELAGVSEAMGPHEREATCESFEVLRSRR
ncbi:MAG: TIGR03792 family protein [Ilumatobacteraceae bacterium]